MWPRAGEGQTGRTMPAPTSPRSPTAQADEPVADVAPPRWPPNAIRASTVIAWVALAAFMAGVVLFLLPVRNRYHGRTLQDCGAPAAFLKDGRTSAIVSSDSPPKFIPKADVHDINAHQCSDLVAGRAVPGAILLVSTFGLGLVAFVLAWVGRRAERRARWRGAVHE